MYILPSRTCFTEGRSDLVAMKTHGITSDTEASTAFCKEGRKGGREKEREKEREKGKEKSLVML